MRDRMTDDERAIQRTIAELTTLDPGAVTALRLVAFRMLQAARTNYANMHAEDHVYRVLQVARTLGEVRESRPKA